MKKATWLGTISTLLVLLVLGVVTEAAAQLQAASAQITQATGRVEVLAKGQTQWRAARVGDRLAKGDQVRAQSGASAQLSIPDGSTIVVAENTRFAVTELQYDARTRDRNAAFHLVAGKVRAQVTQAAVQLVRARESNFTISTPNGVAAVRGTIAVVLYNPATNQAVVAAFATPGVPITQVVWVNVQTGETRFIGAGQFISQVGAASPSASTPVGNLPAGTQQEIQDPAANPATANNPELANPTPTIVTVEQVVSTLEAAGITVVAVVAPTADTGGEPTITTTSVGQDVAQAEQAPASP